MQKPLDQTGSANKLEVLATDMLFYNLMTKVLTAHCTDCLSLPKGED